MRQDVSAQIHNMDKSVEPHSHLICEFRCLKSSTQSVFINICEIISCYKELAELSTLKDIVQLSVSVVIAKQLESKNHSNSATSANADNL